MHWEDKLTQARIDKVIKVPKTTADLVFKAKYEQQKKSVNELAVSYGMTPAGIRRKLRSMGAKVGLRGGGKRPNPNIQHTFFDVIDTEKKAYILGLILSDGNVDKGNNRITIGLTATDVDIVEKIRDIIAPSQEFHVYETQRHNMVTKKGTAVNVAPTVKLNVHSKQMVTALVGLGISGDNGLKTYTAKAPPIPPHLQRHFWRGMVDGDGHIRQARASIGLRGTEAICLQFMEFCKQHIKPTTDVYLDGPNWKYDIGVNTDALTIMHVLYDDATIYLQRKYALYLKHTGQTHAP